MQSDEPFIDRDVEGLATTKCLQVSLTAPLAHHFSLRKSLDATVRLTDKKIKFHPEACLPTSITQKLNAEVLSEPHPVPKTQISQEHELHQKQFEILDRLLKRKNASIEISKKVIQYAEDLLYKGESARLKGDWEKGQEMTKSLGKLLFYIDRAPITTSKSIHKETIDKHFKESIKQVHDHLAVIQKKSPGELTKQTALPVEIAKMLLLSDGSFNPGIIPYLIDAFIPANVLLHNYALSLKGGLQLLQQSTSLRELIETISLTKDPKGQAIVNVVLNREVMTPISLEEQKAIILSGFLTHLRQGHSGNCFASFIAIEQQAMRPEQVLKDLMQLVVEGHLTRNVQGHHKSFPFLLEFGEKLEAPYKFHPLLRIWENSIAGMSEAKSGGLLNTALIKSMCYLFEKRAKRLNIKISDLNFQEMLSRAIEKRFLYLYDPTNHTDENNGYSGAFILHERTEQGLKPIQTSAEFFDCAYRLIVDVFGQDFSREEPNPRCQCVLLRKLLKYYHPSNADLHCNTLDFNVIRYTPWQTAIGNNPKMALKVYMEDTQNLETFEIKPHHAEELMKEIYHLLKAMPKETKLALSQASTQLTPMRIPGMHAFSLMLNHPSLLPFYEHFVAFPDAMEYADMPILKSLRRKVGERVIQEFVQKDQRDDSAAKFKKNFFGSNLHEFRNQLLAHIKDYLPPDVPLIAVQLKLDKWIYEALPEKKRVEIEQSIVHIADSNWQDDIHDIHYGIGVNPASGQIELLNVLDDGRIYKFLNQNTYLQQHTWQIAMDLDPAVVKKWKRRTC